MSSDSEYAKLLKQVATVLKLVVDGRRDAEKVSKALQPFIDEPMETRHVPKAVPTEKFGLLVDLGIVTVPDDYDHKTWLAKFKAKHQGGRKKSFYGYNDAINDENFSNPTHILKPGDKLQVSAFGQVVSGSTTSEERMAFLRGEQAVFTGAQGASLVFDQKRDQLPKGKWYASFDEKDRLWKDADGDRRVPRVDANSGGDFYFLLGGFEDVWREHNAFLRFRDVK